MATIWRSLYQKVDTNGQGLETLNKTFPVEFECVKAQIQGVDRMVYKALYFQSTNGTNWKVTVNDAGVVTTTLA